MLKTACLDINFELKETLESGQFSGYGATFGNIDRGGDVIAPDAFDKSLEEHRMKSTMPLMLWQHSPSQPIGVWDSMKPDSKGLMVSGRCLTQLRMGAEAHILMKNKAIRGLSIGYRTIDYEYVDTERGSYRLIKEAELWEVSLVSFPLQPEAMVTDVKNLTSVREVERILREAGVPNDFAKRVAAHGYPEAVKSLEGDRRDADSQAKLNRGLSALQQELLALKEKINAEG